MSRSNTPAALPGQIRSWAKAEGFAKVGIAPATLDQTVKQRFDHYLAAGHQASMAWLQTTGARRADPATLWPEARTVLSLAMVYGSEQDNLDALNRRRAGVISNYALGRDYHDVIKGALKRVAQRLVHATGCAVKVFVDTAPVLEKPLAQQAGLGWQGKHTNLVARDLGSWFFLGEIMTDLALPPDPPERDHCGRCRACLDICPTNAMPAPFTLDSRRCISYLTIEHDGPIPLEFRRAIGNRIYGCDDCLAICPWNKFAKKAGDPRLADRQDLALIPLDRLSVLDDAGFRTLFRTTPVKRIGRDRFVRNVMVAIGNSGDPELAQALSPRLTDGSAMVRAMAVWALHQLAAASEFQAARTAHRDQEADAMVLEEWDR